MTESARRRSRGWKILGIVVGVILGCLGALFLWVSAVAARKFREIEAASREKMARWQARDASRPVLRGASSPGNAWDDYTPALSEARGIKNSGKLGELATRDAKADPGYGKEVLAAHPKPLELLRQGAGRATSRYPYEWTRGPEINTPGLLAIQNLGNLGVVKARALAEDGRPREAVGVLLDVCQFSRDVADDGMLISEMIGLAIFDLGLGEARELLAAGSLDADSLRDLEAGLAVLDGSFPSHARTLENESMFIGMNLRNHAADARWSVDRLLFTNAYELSDHALARAAKADALPWVESRREQQDIETQAKESWNSLYKIMIPGVISSSRVGRDRRAQLRLLWAAARFKATGEVMELPDPFGGTLKLSRGADTLKVWSVGSDGVDDGGTGAWKSGGKDIVLDVKR